MKNNRFALTLISSFALALTFSAHAGFRNATEFSWTFPADTVDVPADIQAKLKTGFIKDSVEFEVFFHVSSDKANVYNLTIGSAPGAGAAPAPGPIGIGGAAAAGKPGTSLSSSGGKDPITCDGSFHLRASTPEAIQKLIDLKSGKIKLPKVAGYFAAIRAKEEPFHMSVQDPWWKPSKTTKKIYEYNIQYEYFVSIESEKDYGDLHLEVDTPIGKAQCKAKLKYPTHHSIVNNPKEGAAAEVATDVLAHSGMH